MSTDTKTETLADEIDRYATTLEDIAERWGHEASAHTRQVARRLRVILRRHVAPAPVGDDKHAHGDWLISNGACSCEFTAPTPYVPCGLDDQGVPTAEPCLSSWEAGRNCPSHPHPPVDEFTAPENPAHRPTSTEEK